MHWFSILVSKIYLILYKVFGACVVICHDMALAHCFRTTKEQVWYMKTYADPNNCSILSCTELGKTPTLLSLFFFFFKYGISKVRLYPGEEKFCHQNGMLIARALFKLHCNSFSNIYFVGLRKWSMNCRTRLFYMSSVIDLCSFDHFTLLLFRSVRVC